MTLLKIPWSALLALLVVSPLFSQGPPANKQIIAEIAKIGGKVTFDEKVPDRIVAVNY